LKGNVIGQRVLMKDDLVPELAQTYISAMLADVFTRAVAAGIAGSRQPLDLTNAFLGGLQTGTTFIAPTIAAEFLKTHSAPYRLAVKSGTRKPFRYVATSVVSSAIIAAVNYPISKVAERRTNRAAEFSLVEFANFFADQILPGIGFPVVYDYLEAAVPRPTNSLAVWARASAIQALSGIGAIAFHHPLAAVRDGATLSSFIDAATETVVPAIVLTDAVTHFSKVTGFLTG
jgi:hypothetical protein